MLLYTISKCNDGYRISKLSEDLEPLACYNIKAFNNGKVRSCDCPAGMYNRPCKHQMIFRAFWALNRINLGWFFIPELNKWLDPIKSE